jgi:DNA polymerase (family 10)
MKEDLNAKTGIGGPELIRMYVPFANSPDGQVQVDFYAATEKTWGVLLLIRTGSTQHNIKLCSWAKSMGLMLSAKDGVIKNGKVIASQTEEDIFKALCMEYVPPEKREL